MTATVAIVAATLVGLLFALWVVLTVARAYFAIQNQRAHTRVSIPRRTARQPTDTPLEADD